VDGKIEKKLGKKGKVVLQKFRKKGARCDEFLLSLQFYAF